MALATMVTVWRTPQCRHARQAIYVLVLNNKFNTITLIVIVYKYRTAAALNLSQSAFYAWKRLIDV